MLHFIGIQILISVFIRANHGKKRPPQADLDFRRIFFRFV
jgi:hypothetical protein